MARTRNTARPRGVAGRSSAGGSPPASRTRAAKGRAAPLPTQAHNNKKGKPSKKKNPPPSKTQSNIDPRNIAPPPPQSDGRPKLKKWKGGFRREFDPPDWKLQCVDAHFVKENFRVENVVDEFFHREKLAGVFDQHSDSYVVSSVLGKVAEQSYRSDHLMAMGKNAQSSEQLGDDDVPQLDYTFHLHFFPLQRSKGQQTWEQSFDQPCHSLWVQDV